MKYDICYFFRTIEEKLLKVNKRKIQVPQSDVCHFFRTIGEGFFEGDVADGEDRKKSEG